MWSCRASSWKPAALLLLGLTLALSACRRYEVTESGAQRPARTERNAKAAKAEKTPAAVEAADDAKPAKEPRIKYSALHDDEIEEILKLAGRGRWEEAETRANALIAKDPQDSAAQRLKGWVEKQREVQRNKQLEDRIRNIEANESVFNPNVKDFVTESKDRGLPPRKDVRDVVDQIESAPYIPPNFGRTNYLQGILFDMESQQGRMARILEKPISIHLDNASLETVIFTIGQNEGINFVADKSLPAFQQKLSINMDRVKLWELLRYISRNLDVQFQVGDDLIWIVDGKDPKKALEETRFYRLRKGFILPARLGPGEAVQQTIKNPQGVVQAITESQTLNLFVNDLAPTTVALERAITNFFTGSKYMIDFERNMILARGTREQLEVMDRIVQEFDKPIQQVFIEARFITIGEAAFLRLGALWETGRTQFEADRETATASALGLVNSSLPLQETFTNILGRATLSVTLSALDQSGESQLLSAPRLTVINNLPATISDGRTQYYYEEYQVKQQILERRSSSALVPSGKPTKINSGASLDVLASIGGDGRTIFLALHPSVNSEVKLAPFATITDKDDAGNVVSTFDIKLPEYRTQELSTRVAVRSGQTVVMGGVLERQQTTFVESVPILGNLPIIGAAFRRRTEIDRPRYLLVFVTATLISESGEFLIYDEEPTPAAGTGPRGSN